MEVDPEFVTTTMMWDLLLPKQYMVDFLLHRVLSER